MFIFPKTNTADKIIQNKSCTKSNLTSYANSFIIETQLLKSGYMEFAMAGNYSTIGIQLLLTRRVSYC